MEYLSEESNSRHQYLSLPIEGLKCLPDINPLICSDVQVVYQSDYLNLGMGSKSATGLMEWAEPEGAMDAFVMANHQTIYSGSKRRRDGVWSR